ncbi:ABC transporter ATP-binding protein [Geodermatophilus sp. URMC 64]
MANSVSPTTSETPLLELRGVGKSFGGLHAVRDVNVTVGEGERVGLLGPNGAGKTTLTNLVAGDLRVSVGDILLRGEALRKSRPHDRFRRGLARTYQVANPFPAMTALESATLGALVHTRNVKEAEAAGAEALDMLQLSHTLSTPMRELNIVEMKEVELARIVASRPALVFLDEVLAGLRPTEISDVLDVVESLAARHNWAVVMIEHLVGAVMRFCSRLIVMNEGRVIADGAAEDVAHDEAVIDAYLGSKWRSHARGA